MADPVNSSSRVDASFHRGRLEPVFRLFSYLFSLFQRRPPPGPASDSSDSSSFFPAPYLIRKPAKAVPSALWLERPGNRLLSSRVNAVGVPAGSFSRPAHWLQLS
jgi:hypothetical protein